MSFDSSWRDLCGADVMRKAMLKRLRGEAPGEQESGSRERKRKFGKDDD